MQSSRWQADQDVRRFQTARMTGSVDPREPTLGIGQLSVDGRATVGARLLAVDLAAADPANPSDIDIVARGDDLAVTYFDRPAAEMRAQVYWRAAGPPARTAATIELLVSVQTGLLDSCPRVRTASHLPADEVLRWMEAEARFTPLNVDSPYREPLDGTGRPCGYLFRLSGTQYSYAEMVHPADARETIIETCRIDGGPAVRIGHALFADHLEKGVILRARVLGVVVDRADDERAAIEHFAQFLTAKLPLTT